MADTGSKRKFTAEHRVYIVEAMVKTQSAVTAKRRFQRQFKMTITEKTVRAIFKAWKNDFTVEDLRKGNSGQPKTARTPEKKVIVRDLIQMDSRSSVRKLSAASGINKSSVHVILKCDLNLKPFKIQQAHEMKPGDDVKRLEFCRKIQHLSASGELNTEKIIFSDESHVYLRSVPNKQNNREWLPEKPQASNAVPLHSPKVTVWCGITSSRVLGPYFFEDDTGSAVTVTKERYVEMLEHFFIEDSHEICSETFFQQDGATPHTANLSMDWLRERFPERLISSKSDFPWPPRSPDLNPLDFFFWGYMKNEIWKSSPATMEDIKEKIREFCASIDDDVLHRVTQNFNSRIKRCIDANGGLFE